jgi:tRNA A37 threonylcarbamoyladenosine dehydratase
MKVRPIFLKNTQQLKKLLKKSPFLKVNDIFERQLKELFFIEYPEFVEENKERVYQSLEFKKFLQKKKNEFHYIYFPWNYTIIKSVKEKDFLKLKTNRNRDLITPHEQKKLYNCRIAILGLSVGSNIAFIFSLSGIARRMILADYDELETTNLNRVLAGVHKIGINKTLFVAQKLYEQNPYLKLTLLARGISEKILRKLIEKRKIDCIIEEIDNLLLKVKIRRLAKKYKIPVIMITDNGEGVILHIERYDLGYDKIFEKREDHWSKRLSKSMNKAEIAKIICKEIIGEEKKIDPDMLTSVRKVIERKLVSWPQLGIAASLAGIVAGISIRNIFSRKDKRVFIKKFIKIKI